MDVFIAVLALLLSVTLVLIIIAAKGSKTRQLKENRRAARRYDDAM